MKPIPTQEKSNGAYDEEEKPPVSRITEGSEKSERAQIPTKRSMQSMDPEVQKNYRSTDNAEPPFLRIAGSGCFGIELRGKGLWVALLAFLKGLWP